MIEGKRAVLIVDDDAAVRESFVAVLEDEGYSVASAENGVAALTYLSSNPLPCLIVLDLMMPVMSGVEFRERQLADARIAGIPVVVMSAADRGSSIAAELHAAAFLAKPPHMDQVIAVVTRYC